jgi:hypothetical protein
MHRRYGTFCFFNQSHVVNFHLFIHRFAHVVNRQQSGCDANERFHLNSGLCNRLRGALHLRSLVRSDHIDPNFRQWQSMAERNEVCRLLRSLDTGNPRSGEDVSLRYLIGLDQIERLAPEPNLAGGHSSSLTDRFRRYINHPCTTVGLEVSESSHSSAADGDHLAIGLVIVSEIVLCGFQLDHVEKELPKLLIGRAGPQRFHDVELQIAAETRA